jgi:hypothetical protein
MPIPKPRNGENQSDFMGRCMSNPTMVEEYDQDQRAAVCGTAWRNRNKKEENTMEDKITRLFMVKTKAEDNRTITAIGSIQKIDRDRDIVDIDGINVKNYKNNPVVLWAHQGRELPVGKTKRVWKKDGQLNFKIEFSTEKHNPLSDFVYENYKVRWS